MPRRETEFQVNASPEAVWAFIRDIDSLCACVPGVEKVVLVDERTADLTVKEKVGVIPMIVDLRATIDAEDPPRRLQATAKAEYLTMAIEVTLEPSAAGTYMRGAFDVIGTGQLKPIVDKLFEKRATERAAQFGASLEQRFGAANSVSVDGGRVDVIGAAAAAGADAPGAADRSRAASRDPASVGDVQSSPPIAPARLPGAGSRLARWWSTCQAWLRRVFGGH